MVECFWVTDAFRWEKGPKHRLDVYKHLVICKFNINSLAPITGTVLQDWSHYLDLLTSWQLSNKFQETCQEVHEMCL